MSDKEFDKYFRDRLQDHSSHVPADMWQRIQPKERRRRAFLPWFWYLAGLLILFTGFYITYRISIPVHHRTAQPSTVSTSNAQSSPSNDPSRSSNPPGIPTSLTPRVPAPDTSYDSITIDSRLAKIHDRISFSSRSTHSSTAAVSQPGEPLSYTLTLSKPSPHPFSDAHPGKLPSLALIKGPVSPSRPAPPAFPSAGIKAPSGSPGLKWALDIYGSPDWPLTQYRKSSYTFGIKLTWNFAKHFSAQTGLQYSYSHAAVDIHDSFSIVRLDLRLKSLDIPLLLSYKTQFNAFHTSVNTGILLNAHSNPHAGSSFYIGVNVARRIGKHGSLYIEPYYRHRFSDIDSYDYSPVFHKMDVIGISIGINGLLSMPGQRKGKE